MRRVAITGFGVVSPIGLGQQAFFRALVEARSGIARITHFDCSTFEVQLAGEVKELLPLPADVAAVADRDRKVGFGFHAAAQALAQAGYASLFRDSLIHIGVSVENFSLYDVFDSSELSFSAIMNRCLRPGSPPVQNPLDACAAMLMKHFSRGGYSLTNCSACAAGIQAIGHSFREIRAGRCNVALCGGADSMLSPLGIGGFQRLGALSTDTARGSAACRPFDADRSGAVLGEGAAIFVLESVDQARADGRLILAEISGYGSSLDAFSLTAPDPDGDGAARAMQAALDDAKLPPDAIGHINTHGTGTMLNDEVEAAAIRHVFADCWDRIPVSATKSVTGHLIAASGAVEVGACLLAFIENLLPANPSLERIGRGCELAHVTNKAQPFQGEYALTNSFGFGGQNAALILRRYHD